MTVLPSPPARLGHAGLHLAPASARRWALGMALAAAVLLAAAFSPLAAWLLGGLATLLLAAAGLLLWRLRATTAVAPPCDAVAGLRQLDGEMLAQLGRAVGLSESSALRMIERVTGLRTLSGRLMDYLHHAQGQSARMQTEIERNGSIVAELAAFVQQLPRQIARERVDLEQMVGEVRRLSSITETIRGMARQTEILSINAAIAAARAGEAGRGFSVLAGEVRRLALESRASAEAIDTSIRSLVERVQARSSGEFAERMRHNEAEAARLLALTDRLDEGYLDMRQFYAMLLTAITEHNSALDHDITALLDTAQTQDVMKQIVDRLQPAFAERDAVLSDLIGRLRSGHHDTAPLDARATALAATYLQAEAAHRDPDAAADAAPGAPGLRIELF